MAGQSYQDRLDQIITIGDAWKLYAPDKVLAGLTLDQYRMRVVECQKAQHRVDDLEGQLLGARNDRDRLFEDMRELCLYLKNAVSGDPALGPDSTMYEAMGYVRRSERKSGLTRRKKPAGGEAPAS